MLVKDSLNMWCFIWMLKFVFSICCHFTWDRSGVCTIFALWICFAFAWESVAGASISVFGFGTIWSQRSFEGSWLWFVWRDFSFLFRIASYPWYVFIQSKNLFFDLLISWPINLGSLMNDFGSVRVDFDRESSLTAVRVYDLEPYTDRWDYDLPYTNMTSNSHIRLVCKL